MRRAVGVLFCGLLLLTQSGCFTLLSATLCAASSSANCGDAISAGVTADAIVLEAAAHASAHASYEEREPSFCAPSEDPHCHEAPDGCCDE